MSRYETALRSAMWAMQRAMEDGNPAIIASAAKRLRQALAAFGTDAWDAALAMRVEAGDSIG